MACTHHDIVPFVSPSALFIRGMVAQCPALRPIATLTASQNTEIRARCERTAASMIRKMPYLPRFPGEDELRSLADASPDMLKMLVAEQRRDSAIHFHRRWCSSWKEEDDPRVRLFGAMCATILTEIFRKKRQTTTRAISGA